VRRIPKTVQLMGHTIRVHVISKRDWEALSEKYPDIEDAVGYWSPKDGVILIKRQVRSQMLHTMAHELCHAILDTMSETRLSDNEKFVDTFGGLLAQAWETAK
jgi:Zn-dependent peptidase ImmA (M78 family)